MVWGFGPVYHQRIAWSRLLLSVAIVYRQFVMFSCSLLADLALKQAALTVHVDGHEVHVGGMAKGSGMIHPNMATLLALVTCDADVHRPTWQQIV